MSASNPFSMQFYPPPIRLKSEENLIAILQRSGFPSPEGEVKSRRKSLEIDGVRPFSLRRHLLALSFCSDFTMTTISHLMLVLFTNKEADSRYRAALTIFALLRTDLQSIQLLCSRGFDMQARNILRSVRERTDVTGCCCLDGQFAARYISARLPEEVNQFWHQNIRGGKARRHFAKRFSAIVGSDDDLMGQFWGEWRKETDAILHASEHVFHEGGWFAMFPANSWPDDGLDGFPSKASIWTCRTAMMFCWELLMIVRLAFSELRDQTYQVEGENNIKFNESIKKDYIFHSNFIVEIGHSFTSY